MTAPTPIANAGSVFALGIRAVRLDATGAPLPGADSAYVTDNLVKIGFTLTMRDGPEVEKLNGVGRACLYYQAPPSVKRLEIDSLEVCYPDPELDEFLAGGDLLADATHTVGYAAPEVGTIPNVNGIAIEAWSHAVTDEGLDPDFPYIRWLFPREWLSMQGREMTTDPMASEFKGYGQQNPNYGTGAWSDWEFESSRVFQYYHTADIPDLSANGLVAVPPPA